MDVLEQTRALDRRVAELAEGQHGVVARRQLEGLGMGREGVEVRLRAGRLYRLHRGVYGVGYRPLTREGRWMAAVLFCGPQAVLSHGSAATLWGIRNPSSRAIEITAPAKSRSRGSITRHCAVLPPDEMTERRGIPVTTVPRTIFDLAAVSSVAVAESALRESEYQRLHDRLSLPHLLARYPRHRGARAVRECLARRAESPGRTRSWLEERFLPFLREQSLPPPQLNVWLQVGGRSFEVDCLWPTARVVVELDGFAAHGTRIAFRADRARDRILRVAGYGVTRIAPEQLDEEGEAIATDLQALLAGRAQYKRP